MSILRTLFLLALRGIISKAFYEVSQYIPTYAHKAVLLEGEVACD